MALPKIVADLETSLAARIAVGGTTGTLVSNVDDDGVTLADGTYYFTLDGDNSSKEYIRCTKTGTALSAIYSYSRQGVATSGTAREHRVGAKVVMTDYATYKEYFSSYIIAKRVVSQADDATAVIDVDATDLYVLTAVANPTTFSITGTPVDGQTLVIRFKDAGVAKALTWDAVFRPIGLTLPTTTVASKTQYVGCVYNSSASKWDVLAVGLES